MFALRTLMAAMSSGGIITTNSGVYDAYWSSVYGLVSPSHSAFTSNSVIDQSSNNFAVTSTSRPAVGTKSPFNSGWSCYFNGSTDSLAVPSSASFNLNAASFTVEAWVLWNGGTAGTIVAGGSSWAITVSATGVLTYTANAVNAIVSAAGAIVPNSWTHIAVAKASATTIAYINGVAIGSTTSVPTNATSACYIGATDGTSNFFAGSIHGLRIVNGSAVYTTSFSPPTVKPTAITNTVLLTLLNRNIVDESTNGFVISSGSTSDASIVPIDPYYQWDDTYWSAEFNGTTDYVSVANNTAFEFGTGDFTIEMWIKLKSFDNGRVIFTKGYSSSSSPFSPFLLYTDTASNKIAFYSSSSGTSWNIASNVTVLSAPVVGRWYHIAVTRQGNTFRTFADGVVSATFTSTAGLYVRNDGANSLTIGADRIGALLFNGYVSNLRLIKGAAEYTVPFNVPTEDLTAITGTSLLMANSPTLVDHSTNAFTLTPHGGVMAYGVSPFSSSLGIPRYLDSNGKSLCFDGASMVSLPNSSAFSIGTGDFTIECWAYSSSMRTSPMGLVSMRYSSGAGQSNVLAVGMTSLGRICWADGTGWLTGNTTLRNNHWYHLAVTRQSGTLRMFINGVLDATFSDSTSLDDGGLRPLNVGGFEPESGNKFQGMLSDVRVNNTSAVYTAAFTPPASTLGVISGTAALISYRTPIYDAAFKSDIYTGATTDLSVQRYSRPTVLLDGTTSLRFMPNASVGTAKLAARDFTAEAWVYSTDASQTRSIFFLNGNANSYAAVRLDKTTTGFQLLMSGTGSSWTVNTSATVSVPNGEWHHVAITRSGTAVKVFYDGAVIISATFSGALFTGDVNQFGSLKDDLTVSQPTWPGNFVGNVFDFRFTLGVARYTAAFSPVTSSLT